MLSAAPRADDHREPLLLDGLRQLRGYRVAQHRQHPLREYRCCYGGILQVAQQPSEGGLLIGNLASAGALDTQNTFHSPERWQGVAAYLVWGRRVIAGDNLYAREAVCDGLLRLHERPPVGSAAAEADVHAPAQAGAVKCGIL